MSTDEGVRPEAVEQTRQEIRALVGEIARLARMELDVGEFCGEFLGRVVSAMAAVGGAVWLVEDNERLGLLCQTNLQKTAIAEKDEQDQARHGRLLQQTLADDKGLLVPPHGSAEDGQQAGNPTDYLLVLAPLRTGVETVGVLEIFQRPDTGREAQRGYLRFTIQMCELAGDFFRSRQLQSLTDRQALWSRLDEFVRAIHTDLDVRRTAYTIANEGRRLIECDRVSLAVARGRKCTIQAISGQDVFEKRSNTVRLLGTLAGMVAASRESIWYTGDTGQMAPQIEEVMQEYVDESQSKAVGVLRLLQPKPLGDDQQDDPEQAQQAEQVVGVLIVERIEDNRIPENMRQRIDFVCQHAGSALANAAEHQSLFLMPLWKTLGKAKWVVRARTLPKTVAVLAAVILLAVLLLFWPASFEMEASGTLEPLVRRNVFAGLDGRVEEVLVQHGQQVSCHAIMGNDDSPLPGPIWARFLNDPQDASDEATLLVLDDQGSSFLQGEVQPGDTVRVQLPRADGGQDDKQPQWYELLVRQVVDERTLRLQNGPPTVLNGSVPIEVWRISPLARLRSTELEMNIASVTGKQMTIHQQILALQRVLLDGSELPDAEETRLYGQLAELEEELRGLDKKLTLYRKKQEELLVTAPSDGLVMTWEVGDRLTRRPVRRGQMLMQIADPNRPWQLELQMPERQMGHVLNSQQELNEQLEVTYVLATDPGTEHTGRVVEIHRAAEVRGDEGNTVLIKAELGEDFRAVEDGRLSPYCRPGAELQARVRCGRRCLGYVLFHDLIAFIQSRILFRL